MSEPNIHPDLVEPTKVKLAAEAAQAQAVAAREQQAAAKLAAETRTAEASAAMQELSLVEMRREADEQAASDERHHVHWFTEAVASGSVKNCITKLSRWSRMDPQCDITVVFNSPGGGVIDGMALFDFLTDLRARGHKVTTVCRGYAASMGGILLQAGDHRVMGRESYLLIHELSAGTMGKVGQIEDDLKFYKQVSERVINIFLSRCGGKCTRTRFVKAWNRADWWLSSDQALKLGFVDEVA